MPSVVEKTKGVNHADSTSGRTIGFSFSTWLFSCEKSFKLLILPAIFLLYKKLPSLLWSVVQAVASKELNGITPSM